jgi:hypothetical protein
VVVDSVVIGVVVIDYCSLLRQSMVIIFVVFFNIIWLSTMNHMSYSKKSGVWL